MQFRYATHKHRQGGAMLNYAGNAGNAGDAGDGFMQDAAAWWC